MRNIVLVTVDSLRADHCGFMGYERETTPTLDRMADEGLVFENAIAPGPSTPESMPIIFTGEYPTDTSEEFASQLERRRERIGRHMRSRETLAERLSRHGYETIGFSPNPYTSRYFGFDEGFDHYQDFIHGTRDHLYERLFDGFLKGNALSKLLPLRVVLNWVNREEAFKPWEDFYGELLDRVQSAEQPYFLWVLLMDVHDPYLTPDEYRTQSAAKMYHANWRLWWQDHEPPFDQRTHDRLVTAYDDTIRYADAFLDRLRTDLADDDPVYVVHADHGEAFGEHGTYGHHPELYEENVRVPFVVSGHEATGTVTTPQSLREIPSILTEIASEAGELSVDSDRPFAVTRSLDGEKTAIRGQEWKYVQSNPEASLFDLRNGEHDRVRDRDMQEAFRSLLARHDRHGEEVQHIDRSVCQLVTEESL